MLSISSCITNQDLSEITWLFQRTCNQKMVPIAPDSRAEDFKSKTQKGAWLPERRLSFGTIARGMQLSLLPHLTGLFPGFSISFHATKVEVGGEREGGRRKMLAKERRREKMLCHPTPPQPPPTRPLAADGDPGWEESCGPVVNEDALRTLNQSQVTEQ